MLHDVITSLQGVFRAYSRVYCSLKLVNFGLMLNCFGPVRSGENIIWSVRDRGHRIYYFSVRSGSGQEITGRFGVGVPKTLPRRTLVQINLKCLDYSM